MIKKIKNQRGFTLIEMMIVIAILGILAAIISPSVLKALDKGRVATTVADYQAIKSAVMSYHMDTAQWPTVTEETNDLINKPNDINGWDGAYLESWPNNPWGGNFSLEKETTSNDLYLELSNIPLSSVENIASKFNEKMIKQKTDNTLEIYVYKNQ